VAPAVLSGTLYEAVREVVDSYRAQGAMTNVEAVFLTGNRVLVVRRWDRFSKSGSGVGSDVVPQIDAPQ
jgi:hypothetical protein